MYPQSPRSGGSPSPPSRSTEPVCSWAERTLDKVSRGLRGKAQGWVGLFPLVWGSGVSAGRGMLSSLGSRREGESLDSERGLLRCWWEGRAEGGREEPRGVEVGHGRVTGAKLWGQEGGDAAGARGSQPWLDGQSWGGGRPGDTHAWMDSVTEPIWLTFNNRQLQAFFSTAWAILLGLVTVRSSPTIWMLTPERNEVQVAQSSWSKGSSMETTGGGGAGAGLKVRGASRGGRPGESGWGFRRG